MTSGWFGYFYDRKLSYRELWIFIGCKPSRKEPEEKTWNGRFDERSKSLPGDNDGFFREGTPPTEKREKVLKGLPPDSTPSKTERIVWSLIGSRYTRHLISSRDAIFMQIKTQNISLYGGRKIDRKQNSTSNCNYETLYWISHEFIAQRSRSEHFVSCSLRIFKCSLCSLNMCSLCVRIFSK